MHETKTPARLSPRERRCLELSAQHLDSEAIGAELGIAASTLNRYIHDASRKLGARNRKEAARLLTEADALGAPPTKNWGGNEGVGADPIDPAVVVPQSNAAERAMPGWQRLIHFERSMDPTSFGPMKRLLAMIVILLGLSLGLGLAVIAAAGLMAIYGSLRF